MFGRINMLEDCNSTADVFDVLPVFTDLSHRKDVQRGIKFCYLRDYSDRKSNSH